MWGLLRDKQQAPDFKGILPSVSYAPFEGTAHPDVDNIPNAEKIRADLKTLAPLTRAIRLYSSTGGVELVPRIANEAGLKVTVGAWIDKNADRNEREMLSAIELAKRNGNVNGIVVGNETIYRGEQKIEDLIKLIQRVKGSVNVPVTTGEIWNIWRDNPNSPRPSISSPRTSCPTGKTSPTSRRSIRRSIIYQLLRDSFPASAS
jgi:exo-beta-1,3-glucanase (GH17 family)